MVHTGGEVGADRLAEQYVVRPGGEVLPLPGSRPCGPSPSRRGRCGRLAGVLAHLRPVAAQRPDHHRRRGHGGYGNVDGAVALTHGPGCETAPSGEGIDVLLRVMRGYLAHPNFAGFLILGLCSGIGDPALSLIRLPCWLA